MTPPDAAQMDTLKQSLDEMRREGEDLRRELVCIQRTHARLAAMLHTQRAQLAEALERLAVEPAREDEDAPSPVFERSLPRAA